ncbi:hypothetical protein BDW62DRAFT_182269 [Aspergillus aurantiobrunneus]
MRPLRQNSDTCILSFFIYFVLKSSTRPFSGFTSSTTCGNCLPRTTSTPQWHRRPSGMRDTNPLDDVYPDIIPTQPTPLTLSRISR